MVVQYPDHVLTDIAQEVNLDDLDEVTSIKNALLEEYDKLSKNKAGLAAPQIGISKRAFVIYGKVVFNPSFVPAEQMEVGREGCYSVDNASKFFDVWRPKYGWATYYDSVELKKHTEKIKGMGARVFQHELDHLNGKLCHTAAN